MKYQLTKNDVLTIEEFVTRSTTDHRSYGRLYDKISQDIRVGKAGEIAYKNFHGSDISEIDWSGRVQTNGIDFTHQDGRGIQIKTIRADSKWCSFTDWQWDTLAVIREIGDQFHLIGEFDKAHLEKRAKPSNWHGWYFNPLNC
jgi:hypothetical protein